MGIGGTERHLSRLLSEDMSAEGDASHTVICILKSSPSIPLPQNVRFYDGRKNRVAGLAAAFLVAIRVVFHAENPLVIGWMYWGCIVAGVCRLVWLGRLAAVFNIRHGGSLGDKHAREIGFIGALRMSDVPIIYNSVCAFKGHVAMGLSEANSVVIPNGYSGTLQPIDGIRCRKSTEHEVVVGFIGRHHPDKGSDLLHGIVGPVLARMPQTSLWVVGQGTKELKYCATYNRDSGISGNRIRYLGFVRDIESLLKKMDILVICSRIESFPNIAIEAMAQAVPVVFRRVGDLPLILEGILKGGSTDADLTAEIFRLIELTETQRVDLQRKLVKRVENRYLMPNIRNEYREVWIDALATAGKVKFGSSN